MVTASIVTHKTPPAQLNNALQCLLGAGVRKIFIIDNSPDDSLAVTMPQDPRVIYRHVENRGFGAGHNQALRELVGTDSQGYHLVMNADVWWDKDPLKPLVEYLDSHPDVGLVQPKIIYPDGDLQYTCRMLPTPLELITKRFLPRCLTAKLMDRYLLANHDHDHSLNCPYLTGSFMLFRLSALKQTGLFDERFFMYPEDIDITRRLHRSYKTMYLPISVIVHQHAAGSRINPRLLKIHIVNMIKYFNKWGWLFDRERRRFNRQLRASITPIPKSRRPSARG